MPKIMSKGEFLNVYNFVPFPTKVKRAYPETGKLSGVINYTITPLTPMMIPNSSSNRAFQVGEKLGWDEKKEEPNHKTYDFFSYTNLEKNKKYDNQCFEPVIPGSEIRGVIRNIYETITYSCMGVLNSGTYPSKRVQDPFKPGLIKKDDKGNLSLIEAESYQCSYPGAELWFNKRGKQVYQEGEKVKFNGEEIGGVLRAQVDEGSQMGYIINGNDFPRKKYVHVFEVKKDVHKHEVPVGTIDNEEIERLKAVIFAYQQKTKAYENYKVNLEGFLKKKESGYFPVYYDVVAGSMLFLSPGCITREIYSQTIGSLAGGFAPCEDKRICQACNLFGKVNMGAHTSRLRFCDAKVMNTSKKRNFREYYYNNGTPITLQVLENPRLNNVDFYLTQPEESRFWTYDYYVDERGIRIAPGQLRGRKYFWHQRNPNLPETIAPSKMNRTVRLLRGGDDAPIFEGKLYFENITQTEFDRLLWILNCGSNSEEEKNIAYKIGGGKPLGLGSVKLAVTSYTLRKLELKDGALSYSEDTVESVSVSDYGDEKYSFNPEVMDAFRIITDWEKIDDSVMVSYPVTYEQTKGNVPRLCPKPYSNGYVWFKLNHNNSPVARRINSHIVRALPPISQKVEEMLLPCYCYFNKDEKYAVNVKSKKIVDMDMMPEGLSDADWEKLENIRGKKEVKCINCDHEKRQYTFCAVFPEMGQAGGRRDNNGGRREDRRGGHNHGNGGYQGGNNGRRGGRPNR